MDPDPTPDPTPFLCDFKNAKKNLFIFFSYNLTGGTLTSVLKMYFCDKIEKERIRIRTSD